MTEQPDPGPLKSIVRANPKCRPEELLPSNQYIGIALFEAIAQAYSAAKEKGYHPDLVQEFQIEVSWSVKPGVEEPDLKALYAKCRGLEKK